MSVQYIIATLVLAAVGCAEIRYEPTWDSLDSRPLPVWYDRAKVGIFLHWGVYSVPSFGSEWFWTRWKDPFDPSRPEFAGFMRHNYPPNFTYQDFAAQFTGELFDPQQWAEVLNSSGAGYVVLTAKHHEGFCLWPSKHSWNWNSLDVGPARDLVGDLASAIRSSTALRFGVYHSLMEWYNPLYAYDRCHNTSHYVSRKTLPELYELVNRYKPDLLWSDGDWTGSAEYWQSRSFLAWLYNDSPVREHVVTNDRWGAGTNCRHGGYYTCHDGYNPGVVQRHKFENCFSLMDGSWGYRRDIGLSGYKTIEDILYEVASTVSCGGNVLINVGPTRDGRLAPLLEERLRQLGAWLSVNGAAIYNSRPWRVQHDVTTPSVWYTQSSTGITVNAVILVWPVDGSFHLGSAPDSVRYCRMLGYDGIIHVSADGYIALPKRQLVKSQWAWVIQFNIE